LGLGFTIAILGGCNDLGHQPKNPDAVQQDGPGVKETSTVEWHEFVSVEPPFSIRHPDGWSASQEDRMLTMEPPTRDAAITVTVVKTTRSLEEAADISTTAALPNATPLNPREPCRIGQMAALVQEFERTSDEGHMRWMVTYLKQDDRFAAITANGPTEVVERERAIYQRIMESFEFR
jgi:hypothetical protein